ncbi:hypothetical protein C8J57DRAFT_1503019 [Mycena rebaudengoi]|nr:hypothetical protein C8J57DRAFT_1503019 [Mycena rebaudengoi]
MVEGNVRPRPRGRGAASSSVLSTPTPASSSKGKQKAGLPSFITPTAPGPPDDPWMYLRNPACQTLVRAFDNSYCTEANLDAISSMLNAAAPPLLRHLDTWEELPLETVQFLAQVRGITRFLQQFANKSLSANVSRLASQLPKSRKPIVLLSPEFQIPAAPIKIKSMAELMADSSDEEDAPVPDNNDDDDAQAESDEAEQPPPPRKRAKLTSRVDDDFEEGETEQEAPDPPPKTRKTRSATRGASVAQAGPPKPKVSPHIPPHRMFVLIPPQPAAKTPSKPIGGTIKVPKALPTPRRGPAVLPFPTELIQRDDDPDDLSKAPRDTRVRARSKNESPKPGTFPTPTMKIPSAQVNDALIDPISLEATSLHFFTSNDLAMNVVRERLTPFLELGNPHLSYLLSNMITLRRQAEFHIALSQLYLDDYLRAAEDLAFAMCRISHSLTREAFEARFSDATIIDTLDVFFKRLGYTPQNLVEQLPGTSGFMEADRSWYLPELSSQVSLSDRLYDTLKLSPEAFDSGRPRMIRLAAGETAPEPTIQPFTFERVSPEVRATFTPLQRPPSDNSGNNSQHAGPSTRRLTPAPATSAGAYEEAPQRIYSTADLGTYFPDETSYTILNIPPASSSKPFLTSSPDSDDDLLRRARVAAASSRTAASPPLERSRRCAVSRPPIATTGDQDMDVDGTLEGDRWPIGDRAAGLIPFQDRMQTDLPFKEHIYNARALLQAIAKEYPQFKLPAQLSRDLNGMINHFTTVRRDKAKKAAEAASKSKKTRQAKSVEVIESEEEDDDDAKSLSEITRPHTPPVDKMEVDPLGAPFVMTKPVPAGLKMTKNKLVSKYTAKEVKAAAKDVSKCPESVCIPYEALHRLNVFAPSYLKAVSVLKKVANSSDARKRTRTGLSYDSDQEDKKPNDPFTATGADQSSEKIVIDGRAIVRGGSFVGVDASTFAGRKKELQKEISIVIGRIEHFTKLHDYYQDEMRDLRDAYAEGDPEQIDAHCGCSSHALVQCCECPENRDPHGNVPYGYQVSASTSRPHSV